MKVSELIEILEEFDPEAEVLLAVQPAWPFEHTLAGVCQRSDLVGEDDDGEAEGEDQGQGNGGDDLPSNDVFLVEGTQLRYGNKRAWDVARRW